MRKNPIPESREKLAHRLIAIITRLYQGDPFESKALAQEFGVDVRTIQRDVNERLAHLPIQKKNGCYVLDPSYLGRLTFQEMERFAILSGVGGLFPELGKVFLEKLFSSLHRESSQNIWLVMGHDYEDLRPYRNNFHILEKAIIHTYGVNFRYTKSNGNVQIQENVEPYKLVNQKGIWYLVAWHEDRFKAFSISRIDAPMLSETPFIPRSGVEEALKQSDGIWLGRKRERILIRVDKAAALFFRRRKLLPNQKIEREREDGSLLVSTDAAHPDEVLPIFRYWIPHVQILEPLTMQQALEDGLQAYLKQKTTQNDITCH
jgi:predicted DNA-binding transcriptional regulator YafY